jgi:hypothetical protein
MVSHAKGLSSGLTMLRRETMKPICEGTISEECGKPARWHCVLATRTVSRCEKHKAAFISVVIAYQAINPKDAMKEIISN